MAGTKADAREFVERWEKRLAAVPQGSNNEQQDTQKFWVDPLMFCFGAEPVAA